MRTLVNSWLELILTRINVDSYKLATARATISTNIVAIDIQNIVWKITHLNIDDPRNDEVDGKHKRKKTLFIPFKSYETYTISRNGKIENRFKIKKTMVC